MLEGEDAVVEEEDAAVGDRGGAVELDEERDGVPD